MPKIGELERQYLAQVLDSAWLGPNGTFNKKLEKSLADYLNVPFVLGLNSGTSAIHLALKLNGVKEGDYVLCSTSTFAASAFPILYVGAIPVFIDSEAETWNMDPQAAAEAINHLKAKGIMPKAVVLVHSYGFPAQLNELISIFNAEGIAIIEDAAEALGSNYKEKACGTFGKAGVLSFNGNKLITGGAGGALILNKEEEYNAAKKWSQQSKENAIHYEHHELGFNYSLNNVTAALLLAQFEQLDEKLESKKKIYNWYCKTIGELDIPYQSPKIEPHSIANYWMSVFMFSEELKNTIQDSFLNQNIQARPAWKPMHLQSVFKGSLYFGNGFSEEVFKCVICLPSKQELDHQDFERMRSIFEKMR